MKKGDIGSYRPEWVPGDAGVEFASHVMSGKAETRGAAGVPTAQRPAKLSTDDYVRGILNGDRMILARAITLVESNAQKHFEISQEIIRRILPYTGKSRRVGITGVPGAGKSTFIEALGMYLCGQGHKVAVLAVDPSSSVSKGSILGDKTRMEKLSRQPNAFVRPSPSGGTLGGVARKSRETLLLCEAAAYDTILVETVGVGQGETTVRSMVDFFLVVVLTGAGDDLQGIKKGIMELADAILVNKADGDNKQRAKVARADYEQVLHYLRPATEGWVTGAYTCSSLTGEGVPEIWSVITDFMSAMNASGNLENRRRLQTWEWVEHMAWSYIQNLFSGDSAIQTKTRRVKEQLMSGEITATQSASILIKEMTSKWITN